MLFIILDSLDNFIVDDDDMSSSENEADFYITTNTVFTTPHRYWQLPVVTEISWFKALSVLLLKTFHDMAFNQSIFNGTFSIVFFCDNTMNQNCNV